MVDIPHRQLSDHRRHSSLSTRHGPGGVRKRRVTASDARFYTCEWDDRCWPGPLPAGYRLYSWAPGCGYVDWYALSESERLAACPIEELTDNAEHHRNFVWEEMETRANGMLTALQSHGILPLSALICRPPHEPFEGDLRMYPEFTELQSRYMILKLLDQHNLVHVDPPLAFCRDLTQVEVTCTTTVIDINQHEERGRMRRNCFAFCLSHWLDRRFSEESCQSLKEHDEALLAACADNA